jgi:hypothetical protein
MSADEARAWLARNAEPLTLRQTPAALTAAALNNAAHADRLEARADAYRAAGDESMARACYAGAYTYATLAAAAAAAARKDANR